ncbi:MAG: glycoside hydrolase family 97 protein [Sphingobacteriaceae bacterium]|nr:glycoside hydrolase family 97 protein [Cytophagaceae bacterium]
MNRLGLLFLCLFSVVPGVAQQEIRLASPDGRLVFTFKLTPNAPTYRVTFKGRPLIEPSELGLDFSENGAFGKSLSLAKPKFREGDATYDLVVGKAKTVRNRFREVTLPLTERSDPKRRLNLVVRAYDDGMAFRYELPEQPRWTAYTLADERTTFHLAGDPRVRTLFLPNFTTSHEGKYSTLPLSAVKSDTLMDMPTLFEFPNGTFLAITEAALVDYAGMYLVKKNGFLTSQLSPLPNSNGLKVKAALPHRTPWRVLLISDRIGALMESNLLTHLNEPCKIEDVSWIKPGKTTFPWWNGGITPDTTFAPGLNFDTNKYYIDFCAEAGLEYHSVVEQGGHEWYVSDGVNFQPGPHADATRAVPGLDMAQICEYGRQKGVGIRVWVHWAALYPKLDSAFAQYEKWGLSGMMVDFMDRDDQEMVNIQEEILRKAAAHRLHVQFHGAYKPTGRQRSYPNEFTREGTLNYENAKWNDLVTPDHDLDIVFTRGLAGSTDYHLGGFRAAPKGKFRVQNTRPLMLGTRAHQLAMYVVLENVQGMACDYPDAYRGQPGFDFLRQVPTSWDETRVLDARVAEYAVVARRRGTDWFVGALNNGTARELQIPLSFLTEGSHPAQTYADAPDVTEQPNHLTIQSPTLRPADVLTLKLAAGGGWVMRVRGN